MGKTEGQRRNRAWWLAIGGKAWGNSTLPPTFLPGANAETGTHAELGDYCLLRGGVWITRKSGTSAPPEPFTSTPPTTSTLPHPGALSEPFHSADHFLLGGAFSPLYHVTLGLPGLMWSLSSADTVQQPQPPAFITRPPRRWHPLSHSVRFRLPQLGWWFLNVGLTQVLSSRPACATDYQTNHRPLKRVSKMEAILFPTRFLAPKPHLGVTWCKDNKR